MLPMMLAKMIRQSVFAGGAFAGGAFAGGAFAGVPGLTALIGIAAGLLASRLNSLIGWFPSG